MSQELIIIAALEAEKNLYFTRMQEEFRRAEQAEAELAALKAENERLRCCGNCRHYAAEEFQYCAHPETLEDTYHHDDPYYISAPDPCEFTPSRWEAKP